jgi:hypothetical protein
LLFAKDWRLTDLKNPPLINRRRRILSTIIMPDRQGDPAASHQSLKDKEIK